MKLFRGLLMVIILGGSQILGVRANASTPTTGSGSTIYMPVVMNQNAALSNPGWIGPDGGSILGLVVDPKNENIVYAGSFGGGMFKSVDGGDSWSSISRGLENPKIQSLAIDPANTNILYAGTYRDETNSGYEGIYKSTDGGQSWVERSSNLQPGVIVYSIAIDPTNTSRLYISTRGISNGGNPPWNGKVYRSDNAGASWNELTGMSEVGGAGQQDWAYSITVHPAYPNQVFAATHEYGPWFSTNYGNSWDSSLIGINTTTSNDKNGRSIVVDPNSGGTPTVYFGVWKQTPNVYRSLDGGIHWEQKNTGINGATVYGLTINPIQANELFVSTFKTGVYKTTNYANNWEQSGLALNKTWITTLAPSNLQTVYTGTYGGGVYKSKDGGASWAHASTGLRDAWVTGIVTMPASGDELFASLYGGGILHSIDAGQTWSEFNNGLPDLYINGLSINPGGTSLFALTDSHGLFRIDLAGGSWSLATRALPKTLDKEPLYPATHPLADYESLEAETAPTETSQAFVMVPAPSTIPLLDARIAVSNESVIYLATSGAGLYRSSDGGLNWYADGLGGATIYSLAINPVNENQLFAATGAAGYIKTSSDGGTTWSDLALPGRTAYTLLIPERNPGVLYAGTDSGIYTWDGSSWIFSGMGGIKVTSLAAHPQDASRIIAGTGSGAFTTRDAGATWNPGPAALAGLAVQSLSIDPKTGMVYYGTTTRGVYQDFIP
jgi:photosystem II stability/assembly factor-like uncharacterized protein